MLILVKSVANATVIFSSLFLKLNSCELRMSLFLFLLKQIYLSYQDFDHASNKKLLNKFALKSTSSSFFKSFMLLPTTDNLL